MGIGRIGFAVALALAGAIAVFGLRKGVETDLFSLIGDKGPGDSVVRRLNEVSADSVRVLCADEARAKDLRARTGRACWRLRRANSWRRASWTASVAA